MNEHSKLLQRIIRKIGIEDIVDRLVDRLPPTDLQSLLLTIFQQRSQKITPAQLLTNYINDKSVLPSTIDPRIRIELDQLFYSCHPEYFVPVELSPVGPLGNCSVLATVHQDKVGTTIRNTEVLADATNLMALEIARQRKAILKTQPKSAQRIQLCTSHRHLRLQPLPEGPFTPHFRIGCSAIGGKDEGNRRFEVESLLELLTTYLNFIEKHIEKGTKKTKVLCKITELENEKYSDLLQVSVIEVLQKSFPSIEIILFPERTSGRNYYQFCCFNINIILEDQTELNLGDGGFTDWTQQLLGSKKERLLTGAMGIELMLKVL